ncbi:serine/threonine-protein kinase [Agromyces seonyuensis]|uniref:serine/threonine-protein kinase n=1 Tax=Agromyces seonyuensis TaxID=2662446 RepID=UPI0030147202
MSRRIPSTPPILPGFTFVQVLGSGGFADVFLYEQNLPRRHVAVKVMLADVVTDELRRAFQTEADLMAGLGAHPAILTVHQAGVAADGRPYLVMEPCTPAIGQGYRFSPLAVPDALAVMIAIGGAAESAHRAGILHRDIKPSNILTTAYGHPVLSDFGIAVRHRSEPAPDSVGLSIPWTAPEVLQDESGGSVASEVYSLGATLYSLLAGRSPFERVDGDNGANVLAQRIRRAAPEPIGRSDVPASLEAIIRRSLDKRPEERQRSAVAFVRDLQAVESELGLDQTPIDLVVDGFATGVPIDREHPTVAASDDVHAPRRRRRPPLRPAAQTAGPVRSRGRGFVLAACAIALVVGAGAGAALTWWFVGSGAA